jgi:hypothetical protein
MTRQEHLLTILGEEAVEVAKRCSKALRFGLDEVQPGQELDNQERLIEEVNDMAAVLQMLQAEGLLPSPLTDDRMIEAKRAKVEHFLEYSKQCGTLS